MLLKMQFSWHKQRHFLWTKLGFFGILQLAALRNFTISEEKTWNGKGKLRCLIPCMDLANGLCLEGAGFPPPPALLHSLCYSYWTYLLRPDVTRGSSVLFQRPTCIYPSLHLPRHYHGMQKSSHALHCVIHVFWVVLSSLWHTVLASWCKLWQCVYVYPR